MLHKIYQNIPICFLYIMAMFHIIKAEQNLDSKVNLETSTSDSHSIYKNTKEHSLQASVSRQSNLQKTNTLDSNLDSKNMIAMILASQNLDSIYESDLVRDLGHKNENLDSKIHNNIDNTSVAITESNQMDCHAFNCKARNDNIYSKAALDANSDNIAIYTNYKLASIDTNADSNLADLSQQKSTLDSKPVYMIYGLDFVFYGDNLEGSYPYWDTRTLLQASVFPEIGLHFYGQNLRVGGYYIMNMGEKLPKVGGLSLYYDTTYKNFSGYFGIFPRKHWIGSYPNLYYRKDFLMQNPMTNGMALQYQSDEKDFQAEFIFDWYGGNLQKRIDEFLASAFMQKSFLNDNLFIGGSFLLYHTKNDEILNPYSTTKDVWLLDRLYYNAYIGTDLAKQFMSYMDSMRLSLGVLGSVERKRRHSSGLDPFSNRAGLELALKAQYKGFGIDNSLYYGQGQMQYFSEYGESLYWGLPFYQARFYDRAEMYWEHKNDYCTARFSFIFHFTDTQVANTQMLTIILDTQQLLRKLTAGH